jgi:hypothetical protein
LSVIVTMIEHPRIEVPIPQDKYSLPLPQIFHEVAFVSPTSVLNPIFFEIGPREHAESVEHVVAELTLVFHARCGDQRPFPVSDSIHHIAIVQVSVCVESTEVRNSK